MRLHPAIVALVLLLCAATGAFAQGRPAVMAGIEPNTGTVGDELTYSATITWPEGLTVLPPEPEGMLGECEVLDRQVGDLTLENGVNSLSLTLKLACYKTGDLRIPPLEVHFTDESGEKRMEPGPEIAVNIHRLLPEDARLPQDIKGQSTLPLDLMTPLAIAAGVLIGALMFYALLRMIRRRRKKERGVRIQAPEPYRFAIGRLESGTLDRFLDDGDIDGFYTELTDILREYLEGRFGVQALEMTSTEIAAAMRHAPLDGFKKTDLRKILERADFSKFAKLDPPMETCREDHEKGRAFVEKTRPAPAIEQAPSGPGGAK